MVQRDSFIFYRSFFEAVSELKPKEQTEVILAICEYALNGTERQLSGVQKAVFILIKPNLDANQKKYENGKKGGRPAGSQNQPGRAGKPMDNQIELHEKSEGEPIDNPMDNELCIRNHGLCVRKDEDEEASGFDLPAVMRAYREKINPTPSQYSMDELTEYWEEMGSGCCLRAFAIALDAQRANWPYIRAILRTKKEQGVRRLADWDAVEEKRRMGQKPSANGDPHGESGQEREIGEMDWIDAFLGEHD